MPIRSHEYTRDGVTILWQPDKCIHSGVCVRGLSTVFNPGKSPWIDMSKAETARIAEQVKKCPSGALSLLPTS
ncbi:MAG: (4Fe-4S)-binding protein [Ferruginibacter sp.]